LAHRKAFPEGAVAVTFDDGFAEVRRHALPILERFAVPATLFAVSGYVGGLNEWMDRAAFPARRLLSAADLRDLQAAGMEIGSHTVSHRSMPELSFEEAAREARESKDMLEQIVGRTVRYFAYPYGRFNANTKEAVRAAGYQAACSTRSGFNSSLTDIFELRRIDVFGHDSLTHFQRKLAFGANEFGLRQLLHYHAGRVLQRLH
jgi:peptidoglycan/xylan/chitin deacetylase (PgdA/CDA1 family)